ncbi:dolichol kinase [Prorops nasuta]|uniref:dolichol kinase n=1 Tax=Prorops nasuta TaxID=863751 RepID=UPI0034CE7E3E
MESINWWNVHLEKRISQSLENNGVRHRPNATSGFWLGLLVGICAIITILREDSSYSEICLLVGITGFGLVASCLCLFFRFSFEKIAVKDYQVIYFLPAIITSLLYLLIVNKALLVSVTWGLTVASLGTWGVLQLMSRFPKCFTIGEATAVMHGGILCLLSAFTNLPLRYHLPPIHTNDIITVILQMGIIYVVTLCLLCGQFQIFYKVTYFYLLMISLLAIIILPLLYILLDQDPITWIILFIFRKKSRVIIIAYWATLLILSAVFIKYKIASKSQATTSERKLFHILAVLVYIPGFIYDQSLLYLASGSMMCLFILLELLRQMKLPPLQQFLKQGYFSFCDEKDHLIALTPLYLLAGLSLPLWMPTNNLQMIPLLSGVLSLGIGDTAASIVGSTWGNHKWPVSKKSIEGTVACVASQLLTVICFACFGYVENWLVMVQTTLAIIVVSLVEALTDQIDNLELPLLMYVCLLI